MGGRNVHRGDAAVRGTGNVELPAFDLVVGQDALQEVGEDPVAPFEEQLTVRRGWRHDDVSALLGFGPEVLFNNPSTVFIVCGPPPSAMIPANVFAGS
jgi:hypothetical protein